MKKMYALVCALFITAASFAQGKLNVVIFSEDGEPFFAYVNGIRQNNNAETNIRITDLTTESFHFRIVFANSGNEPLTKNQYLAFGSEYTFKIKKSKKGFKLAPFGQVALNESTSTAPSYTYTATETPVNSNSSSTTATSTGNSNNSASNTTVNNTATVNGTTSKTSETITTTTTTYNEPVNTTTTTGGENVNFNMNVSENGLNVNMNVNGTTNNNTNTNGNVSGNVSMNVNGNTATGISNSNTNGTSTSVTSTTTTTTYSTTSTGIEPNNSTTTTNTNTNNTNTTPANTNTSYNSTASTLCYYPMSDTDFGKLKSSVEAKSFEDTKMSTARQATKNACLNTAQIGEIMKLFMMDEQKLEYAKYAYDYCTEKQNYYQLADVLGFSSTQDEFNAWLEKK